MSIEIDIHARGGLEIVTEFPHNSGSILLRCRQSGHEVRFYLPLRQWWAVRKAFPKADDGYQFHHQGNEPSVTDHDAADEAALAFMAQHQPDVIQSEQGRPEDFIQHHPGEEPADGNHIELPAPVEPELPPGGHVTDAETGAILR